MVADTVDTVETLQPQILAEALLLVDEGLSRLQSRELVSASEVADLLLDVRTVLTTNTEPVNDELGEIPVATN